MSFTSGFPRAVGTAVIPGGVAGSHSVPGALNGPGVAATTAVPNAVWGAPVGQNVTITSATSALPVLTAGQLFEVRNHSTAANNGLYLATGTPTAGSLPATKIDGAAPASAIAEAVDILTLNAKPDLLLSVRHVSADLSVNADLTAEFSLPDNAANQVANTGGTATTGNFLIVTWARRRTEGVA